MQVGDLVKVYHFSHKARRHYKARAGMEVYVPDDIDGHVIGLLMANHDRDWRVLIPEWKQEEVYHEEVLEVISASR
tara:strand:+ start:668 stop:895 length:228 start_codon:yes stop_codon:yes gene_type:complete